MKVRSGGTVETQGWARQAAAYGLLALLVAAQAACQDRASVPDPARRASGHTQAVVPSVATSGAKAAALRIGTRVTLQAREHQTRGVPLHPAPDSRVISGRLPPGSVVTIVGHDARSPYVHVRSDQGIEGWLAPRYLATEAGPGPTRLLGFADSHSPWASREACEAALAGARPPRRPGMVRIGSWNLRWFPDTQPGLGLPRTEGTDIAWLACAIAWLDVSVLAVQEFKTHARARERTRELLQELARRTGGRWKAELDPCPLPASQHVGFLYDERRVTPRGWHTHGALNPHGGACERGLRPGFGAYFRFGGGLDLHLVTVHTKSGSNRRDFELRARTLEALVQVEAEARAREDDRDLILLGDFNTMGCRHCSPPVSATEELALLDRLLESLPVPLRRLPADATCSEQSSHRPALLDHFLATRAMEELERGARVHVAGLCELGSCDAVTRDHPLPMLERVSDHCPIVLELYDRDLD